MRAHSALEAWSRRAGCPQARAPSRATDSGERSIARAQRVCDALRHLGFVPSRESSRTSSRSRPGLGARRREDARSTAGRPRGERCAAGPPEMGRRVRGTAPERLGTRPPRSGRNPTKSPAPQRSHDFRGGAGRASMNHPNPRFTRWKSTMRVEPRIVALADDDRSGTAELGHGSGDRLERTEVRAHEDRAATGCERGIDTRESLVGDVDQVERTHPAAAQQEARRQVLSGADETLLRDRSRFGVGQSPARRLCSAVRRARASQRWASEPAARPSASRTLRGRQSASASAKRRSR